VESCKIFWRGRITKKTTSLCIGGRVRKNLYECRKKILLTRLGHNREKGWRKWGGLGLGRRKFKHMVCLGWF